MKRGIVNGFDGFSGNETAKCIKTGIKTIHLEDGGQ